MDKQKDLSLILRDILECCGRIIVSLKPLTLEQFEKNLDVQDATIRRFEIIGEAVKRVPEEFRTHYPEIPWKDAAGFRDVLIHDYPDIVLEEVFRTGKEQLPEFQAQIKKVLDDLVGV